MRFIRSQFVHGKQSSSLNAVSNPSKPLNGTPIASQTQNIKNFKSLWSQSPWPSSSSITSTEPIIDSVIDSNFADKLINHCEVRIEQNGKREGI